MNIEEVDFPRIVEEIQKIEWPKKVAIRSYRESAFDLGVSLDRANPVEQLAGFLVNEFVIEVLIEVHGEEAHEEGQYMLEQMIAQVLEEAHPDIMYTILKKIKDRMLTEFTEEEWKKYGGY